MELLKEIDNVRGLTVSLQDRIKKVDEYRSDLDGRNTAQSSRKDI